MNIFSFPSIIASFTETLAGIGLVIVGIISLIGGWIIHPYTVGGLTNWVQSPIQKFSARCTTSICAAFGIPWFVYMLFSGQTSNTETPNSPLQLEESSSPSQLSDSSTRNIEASAIGNWRINIDRSPIDDSKTVTGSLDAGSLVKTNQYTERPMLIIRYKEGGLQAFIAFQSFLGTGTTDVTTRFGNDAPTTEAWSISTDHKKIFYPGESAAFVKKLNSSENLVVRVTPSSEGPVTFSFNATGLEAVMDAFKQASAE
jgi:type VI secretion system protein VasI